MYLLIGDRFGKALSKDSQFKRIYYPKHLLNILSTLSEALVEERLERNRVLGAASRFCRALLTPGPATKPLVDCLRDVGALKDSGGTGV